MAVLVFDPDGGVGRRKTEFVEDQPGQPQSSCLIVFVGRTFPDVIVDTILKQKGFDVVSVCCKAGRTSKDLIGMENGDHIGVFDRRFTGPSGKLLGPRSSFVAFLVRQ